MTRPKPDYRVIPDGEAFGVAEHKEGHEPIFENAEPMSKKNAEAFKASLLRTWDECRANEAYWAQSSFGE